jgi:hypothetical protein
MKDNLRKSVVPLIVVLLLLCVTGVIVETRFKLLQRAYDNVIMDNRNHYLACKDLPSRIEVERILEQHGAVLQQIREVAPGFVGIEIDSVTCEGKADLLIWYGTHEQRVAIEKIITDDTFFGIPYRLQNR